MDRQKFLPWTNATNTPGIENPPTAHKALVVREENPPCARPPLAAAAPWRKKAGLPCPVP